MPGKRTRKDSERSIGSSGTPSTSGLGNVGETSASISAGSTSSGSVGDESESTITKICCFPAGCPYEDSNLSNENNMVKVVCSYDGCTTSQFMHTDCFNHWEETLLNFLRSHGRARSWSEKQRRQNLWTKKGYDLIFRACLCKCKHGHLKKDLDWIPQSLSSSSATDPTANKKKNRKKNNKDLPTLGGYNGMLTKSKSKPIPNSKDCRIRHSSASSIVSVDQGYISASPGTAEMGPSVFSPPSHPHHFRPFFFHNSNHLSNRSSSSYHVPSTSPLPEVPDDSVASQFTPSLSSDTSPASPSPMGVFTPPLFSETEVAKPTSNNMMSPSALNLSELVKMPPMGLNESASNDLQAMSTYIQGFLERAKGDSVPTINPPTANYPPMHHRSVQNALMQMKQNFPQIPENSCEHMAPSSFPPSGFNCASLTNNVNEEYRQRNRLGSSWTNDRANEIAPMPSPNAQVLVALRQKEQKEIEKRELNKLIMSVRPPDETKTQVFSIPGSRSRHNSHTEIRLIPMRNTNFMKRYDFSSFQRVLARQHINPYHIKMEGEGYGSDDLRNFILASLSKERCSQMNCVVCGVDMPVYDHFPLLDGTMFLSPEKNERSTKNCFKIKVEGKCEYVHAACMRCMEGLHNIVCRHCNARWEGTHHQLGTLYMFDIFASSPCCQKRLCCKQCGGIVVDIRQGLNYFSDYSSQKSCPHCHTIDYHFIHPITTYKLMGLVFS